MAAQLSSSFRWSSYRVQESKAICSRILLCLETYSQNSSLCAIRYIGDRNKPLIERLFWLITLCILAIICGIFLQETWATTSRSAFIISKYPRISHVREIPFPAVTLCPAYWLRNDIVNISRLTQLWPQLKDDEIDWLKEACELCPTSVCKSGMPAVLDSFNFSKLNKLAFAEPDALTLKATWKGKSIRPTVLTYTHRGFCYTYNLNIVDKIVEPKMDRLYQIIPDSIQESFPLIANDKDSILSITIWSNSSFAKPGCAFDTHKVVVHPVDDWPVQVTNEINQEFGVETKWHIEPDVTETSESLRDISPEVRECYFPGEKNLYYFKKYTHQNCILECWSNITQQLCGCIRPFMPGAGTKKICAGKKYYCSHDALGLVHKAHGGPAGAQYKICDCLPQCNQVSYRTAELFTQLHPPRELARNSTSISVNFHKDYFGKKERHQLYDRIDFIARCGGILALFLGFSIFSVIELFYFIIVRLIFRIQSTASNENDNCHLLENDSCNI